MIIKNKTDIKIKDISKLTAWVNHHTASTKDVQFVFVNDLHKGNWPKFKSELGYFGGYNFLIEKDGTIRQYRKVGEQLAAHKGHNSTKGAICLAGDFRTEKPTAAQEEALGNLYNWLREIKAVPMYYRHGDLQWNNTVCPMLPQTFYKELDRKNHISLLNKMIASLRMEIAKIIKDKESV